MNSFFKVDDVITAASKKAMEVSSASFARIDEVRAYNQEKVLAAFVKNSVNESHFTESTGYGYGDRGRDVLDQVLADCVGSEDSLIRHSLTCGTHTLGVALFGLLRPGDIMLCVTGTPYDTIHGVIGITGSGMGSLKDYGVTYKQVDLLPDGTVDYEGIEKALNEKIAMVYIQRSRGYSLRPSLGVADIEKIAKTVREKSDAVIMVDNCYGEFVEKTEPVSHGADIIAGSLIKNPGGGIAKCGGYIAGRADLVEKCSYRMTVPGLGREVGPSLGQSRGMFMGLFNAPHIVGEALKTAVFAASLFFALCPLLSAFAGALPITMTAALLRSSFTVSLPRAFSWFFTLLKLFILYSHSAARPVGRAARPVFCHDCVRRYFISRMRSACFPPRDDDIAPAVCPYLITALNGSSQHCFRYRHARRAFFPFMRRLPLI